MEEHDNSIVYYQEDKKNYQNRVLFNQVMSTLIFIVYIPTVLFLILSQNPMLYIPLNTRKILIIILFLGIPLAGIWVFLFAFSNRILIIKENIIFPPKVPIKNIRNKKELSINITDIINFKVTKSPKGEVEGVLIEHPNFYIIDIHIPMFPIKAVDITIRQLRKKIPQKERSYP